MCLKIQILDIILLRYVCALRCILLIFAMVALCASTINAFVAT